MLQTSANAREIKSQRKLAIFFSYYSDNHTSHRRLDTFMIVLIALSRIDKKIIRLFEQVRQATYFFFLMAGFLFLNKK
jgi:hypothetical protein